MTSKQFSMSVAGRGNLLGPIISKSFEQFPQAKIYDRSDQFRMAIGQEQQIAPYMNAADRARVGKAVKNMNQPDTSDIQIIVHRVGNMEMVEVSGPKGRSKLSFDFSTADGQRFDAFLREIMRLIRMIQGQSTAPGVA